jgi:hypothetical protein
MPQLRGNEPTLGLNTVIIIIHIITIFRITLRSFLGGVKGTS